MIPLLILAAIASLLFINNQSISSVKLEKSTNPTNSTNSTNSTYKYLVKDLMDHHHLSQSSWINNIKINANMDGLLIGSEDCFISLADNKPIEIVLNQNKINLNTSDTNKAIQQINLLIGSNDYTYQDKNKLIKLTDFLLKAKEYYYLKKYIKYKQLYTNLKNNNNL